MIDAGIPKSMWPEILAAIVKVTNRTATRTLSGMTPYETFMDQVEPDKKGQHRPKVSHLRVLGCKCYVHISEERRTKGNKLEKRAELGILVGYEGTHIYRVYVPTRRGEKIVRTSNVRFDERKGLITDGEEEEELTSTNQNPPNKEQHNAEERTSTTLNSPKTPKLGVNEQITPLDVTFDSLTTDDDTHTAIETSANELDHNNTDEATESLPDITVKQKGRPKGSKNKTYISNPIHERITRAKTSRITKSGKAPAEKGNNPDDQPPPNVNPTPNSTSAIQIAEKPDKTAYYFAQALASLTTDDPTSLKEALASPDRIQWQHAVKTEWDKIKSRETFVIVNRKDVPRDQKVLSIKHVFKTKHDENGNITKFKARLVVRGFEQQYGRDFDQTFAGVCRGSSWKAIIAIAALQDLEIEQMDAVAAFLHGEMDGEAYIELPEGWRDENGVVCGSDSVGLLTKALYGLKQAPRLWQIRLRKALAKLGFFPLKSDNAIYRNPKNIVIIATHVDDFLIIGTKSAVADSKSGLKESFQMEDLGAAKHFVGVRIIRDRSKRTISLVQDGYVEKVLTKFDMLNCSPYNTPMEAGAKQFLQKHHGNASQAEIKEFQSIVGSEMYLAQHIRTDISYAVGKFS